jgi:virulence-associated protein VagC
MNGALVTKSGVLIPSGLLKGLGKRVSIRRSGCVVIVEPQERAAARMRLVRMVRSLRRAAQELGPPSPSRIVDDVNAVRRRRARHR